MKPILLSVAILVGFTSLFMLVKFLQYFVNNWYFLKGCTKENGSIVRWIPTGTSHSAKASWWPSASNWNPIIEYYDVSVGSIQQHEAILPKSCTLDQYDYVSSVEIEYSGKHVRVSDERFVNSAVYSGYYFFIYFTIGLVSCAGLLILYFLV